MTIGKPDRHFDPLHQETEDLCVDCRNELLVKFFGIDPLVLAPLSPPASLRVAG